MAKPSALPLVVLALLLGSPALAANPAEPTATQTSEDAEVIEIEVERPRPDWLFPSLDHPRVQAFFRSDSLTGESLFRPDGPTIRPLVRAGTIAVAGPDTLAERRTARRWARRMIADITPALEACYRNSLEREPVDTVKIVLAVRVEQQQRSAVQVARGVLGDSYGNDCLEGVLAFATRGAPGLGEPVELEIPVWFWLQTITAPELDVSVEAGE